MKRGILLSGGTDSVALAYWKRPEYAYSVDYGQLPAEGEIRAATTVAGELGMQHRVVKVDCRSLGTGDMAGRAALALAPVPEWWPFRNQLVLTLAASRALEDGVAELMFGAVSTDSRHADGKPEFFDAADRLFAMQEGGLRISAPAIKMSTVELVRVSSIPLSLLAWSHSCHTAPYACGICRGCVKHRETMDALGYGNY